MFVRRASDRHPSGQPTSFATANPIPSRISSRPASRPLPGQPQPHTLRPIRSHAPPGRRSPDRSAASPPRRPRTARTAATAARWSSPGRLSPPPPRTNPGPTAARTPAASTPHDHFTVAQTRPHLTVSTGPAERQASDRSVPERHCQHPRTTSTRRPTSTSCDLLRHQSLHRSDRLRRNPRSRTAVRPRPLPPPRPGSPATTIAAAPQHQPVPTRPHAPRLHPGQPARTDRRCDRRDGRGPGHGAQRSTHRLLVVRLTALVGAARSPEAPSPLEAEGILLAKRLGHTMNRNIGPLCIKGCGWPVNS